MTQSATFSLWGRGFADTYTDEYGEPPLEPRHNSVTGGAAGDSFGAEDTTTDDTGWDDDADASGWKT